VLPRPTTGGTATTATVLWQELTVDPAFVTANALGYASRAVHATLTTYGEGAELMPALAERWETLEQGYVYRLHLRRGVRFHNGRLFEARDVHDTFVRLLSPEIASPSNWILRNVRGADDVLEGRSKTLSGITIHDPYTVDIALDQPIAFFLSLLSMNEASIVPAEETRDRERFRLHARGAGPFRIENAVEGDRVVLRRFDQYWRPEQPHLEQLTIRLDLQSANDVADAFVRGELDIAHGLPLKIANVLRDDPQYVPYMRTITQLHTSYFGYDSSTPPFDRVEVRRALNHAINRQRINERLFDGVAVIAQALLPPGLIGYDPSLHALEHDADRARGLMQEAGYGGGFRVEYRTWDTDEFNNSGLLPMIVEDLAAIGITVNVTRHSATEARKPLQKPGHGMVFCGNWYADFPDSDNFFYVFFHSNSSAVRGLYFNSAELDRQIEDARRSPEVDRRADIYRRLNRIVVEQAPIATLFHERFFIVHKPEIRGLRTSLVPPPVRYNEVWIEK
ncbi:MAG TPA: ABC transporter substrate-binding protein, partial [Thermoanaerobaculia bacterium]|nr:ABC transporter substrate-binding protein [Thermoanaerobaculia bacterium]